MVWSQSECVSQNNPCTPLAVVDVGVAATAVDLAPIVLGDGRYIIVDSN